MNGWAANAIDWTSAHAVAARGRDRYVEQAIDALAALSPEFSPAPFWRGFPAIVCGLLATTIVRCRIAAETRDQGMARAAFDLWRISEEEIAAIMETRFGAICAVDSRKCERFDHLGTEAPVFLPTVDAIRVHDPAPLGAMKRGLDLLHDLSLDQFCATASGVFCWLDRIDIFSESKSYSVEAVPACLYADWCDSVVRMGESLLHESIHCWLYMYLNAIDTPFLAATEIYSPWKRVKRPLPAFLHAALVFSILAQYWRSLLDTQPLGRTERNYCLAMLHQEKWRLESGRHGLDAALPLISDAGLSELLRHAFARGIRAADLQADPEIGIST
jgi:hypothetical protein